MFFLLLPPILLGALFTWKDMLILALISILAWAALFGVVYGVTKMVTKPHVHAKKIKKPLHNKRPLNL